MEKKKLWEMGKPFNLSAYEKLQEDIRETVYAYLEQGTEHGAYKNAGEGAITALCVIAASTLAELLVVHKQPEEAMHQAIGNIQAMFSSRTMKMVDEYRMLAAEAAGQA